MNKDKLLKLLSSLKGKLYNKDYLLTWEQDLNTIMATAELATLLKQLHRSGISLDVFRTGLAVSLFRDNSTRTRFSFASAANTLGLAVSDLDEKKSQISHGETVRETATMISFLTEIIGIRDDMFIGEGHEYMVEVGKSLDESFENGVLPQRPSVINLQCDRDHPTQSLSDLAHLVKYFGGWNNLKGRKIAMTWAYSPSYGKPLSVAQGIVGLLSRFGAEIVLAHPEGYELMPDILKKAETQAKESGGSFKVTNSMEDAFRGADVVYPKSWAPMVVMEQRSELLRKGDVKGLENLEKEALAQNAKYTDWEANEKLMEITRDSEALYMHCLPADISEVSCEKGEVTKGVFEKYRLRTYEEASYKPFVIAAMTILTRFKKPEEVVNSLITRKRFRYAK